MVDACEIDEKYKTCECEIVLVNCDGIISGHAAI